LDGIAVAVIGRERVKHSCFVGSGDLEHSFLEVRCPKFFRILDVRIPVIHFGPASDVVEELDTFVFGFLCELGRHACSSWIQIDVESFAWTLSNLNCPPIACINACSLLVAMKREFHHLSISS
jgi:hypothetical protein